ncbi:MAG: aminotransferase class I/II-fold pyridoxal phosphate-dependent enzyme, partial [Euryarchaeota archaeon]|nr:aminotransferase class I/II-fold pyridoxal phosphate-dependent enzyme [Euryarchaeota archaeon]
MARPSSCRADGPVIEKKHVSLNLNVRGLAQSATLDIQDQVRMLRADSRKVCNLGLGQSPFPVPTPMVESLKLNASQKDYLPVAGLPQLREAVAEFHRKKDQVEVNPDEVLIGPGSKELMFLLQLTFYGEIIIPTPCWVSYTPQSRIVGRNVRLIPTRIGDDWKLTPEGMVDLFESQQDPFRPRLLVLNYPSN